MSKTKVIARMRPDGTVVEILDDGSERPFPKHVIKPMTYEAIDLAAAADPGRCGGCLH